MKKYEIIKIILEFLLIQDFFLQVLLDEYLLEKIK
jgi:hypothetical protein